MTENEKESLACYLPCVRGENPAPSIKRRMSSRINLDSQITQQLSGSKDDAIKNLLQSAWALVLHYYTHLNEVCFGCQEWDLAGHVAETPTPVVVRVNIARDMFLREIMEQVKGNIGTYANGTDPEHASCSQFLYNTAVVLRVRFSHPKASRTLPALNAQIELALPEECKVRVLANDVNGPLNLFLEWWHPDISASFAENLSEVYNRMLNNLLFNSSSQVKNLSTLTKWDRNQILEWNSIVPKTVEKCIHEVIEENVYHQPDAEAVCAWDGSLTYAELDRLASSLMSHLLGFGVGPETYVALCFDKSKWNIVAMLAVLKAGGAFVPLDPSHPIPRLMTIVQAVGAKFLLCSTNHARRLVVITPDVVTVDDDLLDSLLTEERGRPRPSRPESKNAAYILFTSGSTGEPKGTVIEHQAFCSGAYAHALPLLIGPDSRMLQFAAHTFDASLVEILTTLMCGGCVCIPDEEIRLNGIAAAIKDMRVNHAVLTPSFVRFLKPADIPGLKKLVIAGEALTQADVETWCCIALSNGYGPTESSVAAIVNTRMSEHTNCHDIGFPVGVRCWVVDPEDHDSLMPIGCSGELLLEGPTLARGYINNPGKTKESFIFDPKWAVGEDNATSIRRFYKTGDLVRYNSDSGSFDFIGRKDTQVKFHGQRIELGEIETHIAADLHSKHSLVSLPKSGPLAQKLVAVVTLTDDLREHSQKHVTPLKLVDQPNHMTYICQMRDRLSSILPAYMVPSSWLCIEAFPLLASQKLDRKQVIQWLETPPQSAMFQCIPDAEATTQDVKNNLTEIHRELRYIWSHVLNIPVQRTSLNNSFLSLGGDSITAMTCMNLGKSKGLGFRVQEILRSKSIIELALNVKAISRETDYHEDLEKPFDLSPMQDLHFQVRNDSQGHFNQSFFLRLNREVNPSDLQKALEIIISRHSMLRARFNYNTSKMKWEQRITRETTKSYRFQFHDKGSRDQIKAAISNSQACLNSITGPMVAIDLFHVDKEGQFLSLVGHHLVIDLVSWRVILEDLEGLLLQPQSPLLLEATLPFQNWCRLQADHNANIALETFHMAENIPICDAEYWGMMDRPNRYGDVICHGFELDKPSTSLLLTECNKALRTEPVDIMLAALLHSFHEMFPDRSLPVVHNEGHGREVWDQHTDISRTIGWFTVIYPIFVQEAPLRDFVETLIHVKDRRRGVNDNGRAYFARSILTDANETSYRHMEITFNFLGHYRQLERIGALFQPVEGLAGETTQGGGAADYGQHTPRFGLFEISAVVAEDTLRFAFAFNGAMKHQDRIKLWITSFRDLLHRASKDLRAIQPRSTIGDFPLLSLDYDDLSRIGTETLPEIGIQSLDDVEDIYPCSPMQEGLLISRTRDRSFYAVHSTYEINQTGGQVDIHRLAACWQQVVDRHAMLRTVMVENLSPNHLYSQIVLLRYDCKPPIIRCADESEVMSSLDAHTMEMSSRKPEHQLSLCVTSTGRVFCRLEMSHTMMDGHSTSIILRDLDRAYGGNLNQSAKPLFSKFVSCLQSQPKQASINFWRSYLVNVEPCHVSILNDGLVAEKQYRTLRLEFNDFARLQSACEQHGFTIANALHGAWGLTLRCYTGSEEVCFGYLLSERDVPVDGVEEAIGPMINMLACRVNMPPEITISCLLEQIQEHYMRSLPFKHTSLADVQHALGLSGTALFNTCVSYRKLPLPECSHEPNIRFSECAELHDPTEYLVTINVEASDTHAVIDLDYWTDTLSGGQAANIAETFMKSLGNIIDHLTEPLKDLEYLSDRHLEQIAKWNCTLPVSINQCVHEVFEQQVKIRPESPAVRSWDGNFTYSQINELSSRLSRYLLDNGLALETPVALCFDKSAYTIIAMLAILKAGGTCVPLDARHPKAALDLRVLEARTHIALSSPSRAHLLEDIVPRVISVDEVFFSRLPVFEEMTIENARPENAAFIIFTSGSTGKPKGVILEHRSLVTSAEAHGAALGVVPSTRFLQFASYSFDNSLEEIFTTLMRGGCVCVPSEDDRMNNLAKAMNELDVNLADLTTTVVNFLQPSDVPSLKTLAIGGEAPTKDIKDTWSEALELQNIYGPTECSINCCHNPNMGLTTDVTNIGRSIGSISWVVNPNDHNHLLPVGCVGELLVEGPILARGYLNNPDKTQQSFIENPKFTFKFRHGDMKSETMEPKTRIMYKTGDLVRYNSDGSLVYIGRKDTQVKLNGQRIELGEIEHRILDSLSSDSQCAVDLIAPTNGKSPKFLVAFVCLKEFGTVAPCVDSELIMPMSKSFEKLAMSINASLMSRIQMYMVPNVYIPVSAMPITSSGKLDRRLLRTTGESLSAEEISTYRLGGRSGRPVSTELEKLLHTLWSSILGVDSSNIGADDTFFRHGGDSISAIRLVTAVRLKGYTLGVADIFQKPTLSDMARSMSGQLSTIIPEPTTLVEPFSLLNPNVSFSELKDEIVSVCQISPEAIEDVYSCTALQEGLLALSSKQPGSYVTQNVYSLASGVDIPKFKAAWEMVAMSQVILRTRIIHSKSHGFLQVVLREPLEWISVENIENIPETQSHLPPSHGGVLCRYAIMGEDSENPQFIWTAHHAVYDGWSLPLLLAEVKLQYYGMATSDSNLRCSYPHFIKYLRTIDQGQSTVFWKDKLDGSTTTKFPFSRGILYKPSPTSQMYETLTLPETSKIEVTVPSIIRAAWALTISIYTCSDDVIFGEILTGRDAPLSGISDMIGPTLATVPMRLYLNRDFTVVEWLRDVQAQAACVIPYQFFGLQNIKKLSDDAKSACDFQSIFAVAHHDSDDADGLFNLVSANSGSSSFFTYPLNVSCIINGHQIRMQVHYDEMALPAIQLKRLLTQFETILANVCCSINAEKRLGDLDLMGKADLSLIRRWNMNSLSTANQCVHEMIDEKARLRPEAIAICSWDGTLTYRELSEYSTSLAHQLQELVNMKTEIFVPICFEKTLFTAVTMLAIMKAGYAFVPLDSQHPTARLRDIVADLGANFMLCSPRHMSLCKGLVQKAVAVDWNLITSHQKTQSPLKKVLSHSPAYAVFTSGSTGKPKGCIIEHASICTGAIEQGVAFSLGPNSRVLQFASYSFDASLLEMMTTLMMGGCVCIPDDSTRLNGVAKFISDMNVNTAFLTPSMAQVIQPSELSSLQSLALVGEAMSPIHVSVWSGKLNLMNAYGPTETSIVAAVKAHMSSDTDPANIGSPIGTAWIVDPNNHNRLVPVGAIGELLIEGPTLAREYLNDEEQTAAVFIKNPKWATKISSESLSVHRRMYKTGDLVRYVSDESGELLYIGRKDHQAKLRGQRLELGEIEHHLNADRDILSCVVTMPKIGKCAGKLVAVLSLLDFSPTTRNDNELQLVSSPKAIARLQAAQKRLEERLPGYMIPSSWVILEELPLLSSGKLNRKRVTGYVDSIDDDIYRQIMQAVEANNHHQTVVITETEARLRSIWGAVFNMNSDRISVERSFLHLGGDSMSAMAVMSKCRSENLGFTVENIITCRSIRHLATLVTKPQLPEREDTEDDNEFDLSPIQSLYFRCMESKSTRFNQSMLLRLTSTVSAKIVRESISGLMKAHPMLRARFHRDANGIWKQHISTDTEESYVFRVRKVCRPSDMTDEIERIQTLINIIDGPLVGIALFEHSSASTELFICAHHLVIDVVSWGIILQDLENLLQQKAFSDGNGTSFRKWCRLQSDKAKRDKPVKALPLDDIPLANFAYWDMDGKSNLHDDAVTQDIQLDVATSNQLLQICHDVLRVEFVDLLLASLLVSFCRAFPDRELPPAIYNEGHGREPEASSIDVSRTVGWFTTFCPIHLPHDTRPHDDCDLVQCISWVKQLRKRIPGKGVPYFAQRLLTWEGNEKYGKHWPMEIAFNYLGQHNTSEASDTLLEPINGTGQSVNSRFDIGSLVPRFALVEISAALVQGHLNLSFSYNKLMSRQNEIQGWISACEDLLGETLTNFTLDSSQLEPTDFRLLPLSFNGLTKLKDSLLNIGINSFDAIEDVYPCSPMQQGILLSQLKDPQTYAYQAIFEVQTRVGESSVNLERLDAAWQEVVQRHAALRTIFVDGSHESSFMDQVVLKSTDARALVLECDDADARRSLSNIESFDFKNGRPPVRLTLCKTTSGRVFGRLDTTNALCDGSSMPIVLRDISRSYLRMPPVTLERPLYSDFIAHLQTIPKQRGTAYWKEYLAGTEPCAFPSLTTESEREKRLGSHILVLNNFSETQEFCKKAEVTTSAFLQFVWGLVIRCYTGLDDICFGYISSGRDVPVNGIQDAVGAFINMLTYKIELRNELSVGDVMKRTQLDVVRSMEHQSVSLAEVQHELGLLGIALFNTVFTLQRRGKIEQNSTSALSFTSFESSDASEYKIAVNIEMTESTTEVHISYWTDYLSEQQVQSVADTFQQTVKDIVQRNDTELQIGDIDFFGAHNRSRVLRWNCSLKEKENRCVHELIDERAYLQSPAATAIQGWDASFTYGELSAVASRLAGNLIRNGVGPEVCVPLCFEKSAWTIVAQLAVLKAGGTFVSLDPSHPEDRLRSLLDDVNGKIVLSSAIQSDKMSKICAQVIIVDQKTMRELQNRPTSLSSPAKPSNSAYVIFTSGSTGKPKGTVIEHGQLCTSALAQGEALHMTSESRVIQFASYTFDASIMEIYTTLIAGGCVCVPRDEDRMNDIAGAVSRYRANWMFSTPSVANTLKPESIPTLKVLVLGGEKLTQGIIERWAKSACVVEAYGPSECAVVCASDEKVDMNGEIVNSDPSTIGRAVGSRSWIVDPRDFNHLVPVGAIGELVVEGHIVGRGYLNDERKTNESFIQDPQWANYEDLRDLIKSGSRMYRTGDLVRYNSDGSISYVARKDMQIKLNGQRIELGEIEYQCSQHMPEYVELAVDLITPGLQAGAKKLAIFFALEGEDEGGQKVDRTNNQLGLLQMSPSIQNMARKLEKSLAKILPSYMIPQLFFPVSALPTTTSGKLDRRKLHSWIQVLSREALKSYSLLIPTKGHSPENQIQDMLQGLWADVLGIPRNSISGEDSFFRLGGDSLTVMKLTGRARSLGVSLSAVDIFRYPTFKDLAEKCGMSESIKVTTLKPFDLLSKSEPLDKIINEVSSHCGVDRKTISDIYPCSPLQEGLITSSVRQSGAYVNRNVFLLSEEVDIAKFKTSWQRLVDEFDLLRTRIVHTASSNFLQVVLKQQTVTWHASESLEEVTEDSMTLPQTDCGLLTKYTLVQDRGSSSHYFVWSIHHALYDAWGLSIILKRLKDLYFCRSSAITSAPYANFINYLQKQDTSASDAFWKAHLSNLSPNSFPNAPNTSDQRAMKTLSATAEISDGISSMNFTIPNLVRAAWAVVLSSRTQSIDVYFGETLTGRNIDVPGITDMAGPVLTTVPTRIQVNPEMQITEYLMEVQRISTEIILHQHSGLQHIKRLSQDAALACDFQNLIVIQTAEEAAGDSLWTVQDDHTIDNFFTYPLVVECRVSESLVAISIHYDEVTITTWEAEKLLQQFSYVIRQLGSFNDFASRTLRDLDMVSPDDRREISQWNRQNLQVVDQCIHELFQRQSNSNPHAVGVHAWDGELTYGELDKYASAVAVYLRSLGVKPEVFVPICLDKSVWTVVVMFGVLMAGGAIVPLDPSHPVSRHQEILEELDTNVILFSPQYSARYTGIVEHTVAMDGQLISNLPQASKTHRHVDGAVGSNAAYAIFTSGSTGKAKGITVDHRAFASSSRSFGSAMSMDSGSRVLQFASLSFDAALMEIFTTLTIGGCVCIPNDEERLKDLSGTICRMDVSWTLLTPSVANLIDPSSVPCLKVLVCGGEAMSPEIIAKWNDKVHLINAYGPSEASVVATINPSVSNESPSCIGYGTQSTLTWVVHPEDYNELSPLGTVGELALEGPTLARGYLNDSVKTEAAFVHDPAWAAGFPVLSSGPRRIHLTGDLVKYLHDGSLEYFGRKDSQVKLNGQRMDLGEIEQRLDTDPRVRHVIVLMPKTGHFQKRLIAIISLHSSSIDNSVLSVESWELVNNGQQVDSELSDIKDGLSKQLPSYMLPQAWAIVNRLPMLVSGKLDRKKVKNWVENLSEETYQMIAGIHGEDENTVEATGVTATLQDIWAQVLNLPREKVKLNRSFLSLGGDSITAMAVVSRSRRYNMTISLRDMLRCESIIQLASTVEEGIVKVSYEEKINVPYSLSPIQQLYFTAAKKYQGSSRFNQSFTLRLSRHINSQTVKMALTAVVSQHSMLRARFSMDSEGRWEQYLPSGIESTYRYQVHTVNDTREVLPLIGKSQGSLNILDGPTFAADLFECQNNAQILFMVAHHLCVDIVSWRIILQDLQEVLESESLPFDKPLSFQAWCSLQREYVKRDANGGNLPFQIMPANLGYWGMDGVPNTYGEAEFKTLQLDETVTASTITGCHGVFRTDPVDVLLTAVIHSFRRIFSDRLLPTLFNEGHGRQSWDSSNDPSRTVGWFTNISPLRVTLESDDVLETLRRVKDARRSLPENGHRYLAHRFLKPKTRTQSSASDVPMEILFNYLGAMQHLESEDSLFQSVELAKDTSDHLLSGDMGPDTSRLALFDISAVVMQGKLEFTFIFNRGMRRREEMSRWMSECKWTLEEIAMRLRRCKTEPTLSDYPLLPISYDGLKILLKESLPKAGITDSDQVEDVYPCSPTTEGILLGQLRDPNTYIFHAIYEVKSVYTGCEVDPQGLIDAWQKVVDRHAALRTVFVDSPYKGGAFDQAVLKNVNSGIIHIECKDSEVLPRLQSIRLRDKNARRKLHLPHQMTICSTDTGRVIIKVEINHAVIDGGSTPILLQDLSLAYEGRLTDKRGPLYSDYVRFIRSQSPDADVVFWKKYLTGVHPCHLPHLKSNVSRKRKLESLVMSFDQWPKLQQYCEKSGVTLSNVVQASWALVLRKYTGSDDVCFGYLSAGRDAPVNGIQESIGVFINLLCCRVQLSSSQILAEIPGKIQDDFLDGLPHQRCSLAQVQHEVGLHGQQLFNTALSIQNHSRASDEEDISLEFEAQGGHDPSEYAVTLNIETARDDEGVVFRYWNDNFTFDQMTGIVNALANAFRAFIQDATQTISGLDIDSSVEKTVVEKQQWKVDQTEGFTRDYIWQLLEDHPALQSLIDERVRMIVQQIPNLGNQPSISRQIANTPAPENPTAIKSESEDFANMSDASYEVVEAPMSSQIESSGRRATLEQKLLRLWSDKLNLPPNSITKNDSFFDLGGDSIAAMGLVGDARDEGLILTVADIFRNPAFEDMVAVVRIASEMSFVDDEISNMNRPGNQPISIATSAGMYERFSLLKSASIDEAFLQKYICPRIGVFKGGIADILPVTDFQALSITGSLLDSRWMLNFFYLDGRCPVDFRRLKQSCFRVVQALDILRTVFVASKGRFLQVILRKVRLEFSLYETEDSLDDFTAVLQQRNIEKGVQQGEPFVQFIVVKEKRSDHHRILVRLSHAQYDGFCLPRILAAIKAGYEGGPIPSTAPFAHYVRESARTITSDHYTHWRTLLQGSSMTQIVHRRGPSYGKTAGATQVLTKRTRVPSLANGNITTATVIKAAWALTLARITGNADVVFGHTISGRNTGRVTGVESMVGPCVNVVPVRVQFRENWTALDLLRNVQDQQVANMPFEALGFRQIIKHCTDWPRWAYFSTVLQHDSAGSSSEMQLGGNDYQVKVIGSNENLEDFMINSRQVERDHVDIAISFSGDRSVPAPLAQRVLDMMCDTAESFAANPSMNLPTPVALSTLPSQAIDEPAPQRQESSFTSAQLTGLSRAEMLILTDVIRRAWEQVLTDKEDTRSPSSPLKFDSSFFELGGDLIGLAQVAWLLEQEDFKVRLNDLIEHPTMAGQMAVLVQSNSAKTRRMMMATAQRGVVSSPSGIEGDGPVVSTSQQPPPKSRKSSSWASALSVARRLVTRRIETGEN